MRRSFAALVVLWSALGAAGGVPAQPSSAPIQHGAQPNPGEVRPPSPDGNIPSPGAGSLQVDREPAAPWGISRGLIVTLAAVLVALLAAMVYGRRGTPRASQHR